MVAMFKVSCVVFWIIWMCTLSFLFGIIQYQGTYSYIDDDNPSVTYMIGICSYAIIMSYLGCCCVKCDITHIFCSILFVAFTAVILTAASGYVLFGLEQGSEFSLNELLVLKRIMKHYDSHANNLPNYLAKTERQFSCCGIFGFKDYRAFIFTANVKQDVPYSCCKDPTGFKKNVCPDQDDESVDPTSTLFDFYTDHVAGNYTLPISVNTLKQFQQQIIDGLYGKPGEPEEDLWLPLRGNKSQNIYNKGCYNHIKGIADTLHTSYVTFCIVLMFSAIIMSIVYIQNCFKARHAHFKNIQDVIQDSIEQQVEATNNTNNRRTTFQDHPEAV